MKTNSSIDRRSGAALGLLIVSLLIGSLSAHAAAVRVIPGFTPTALPANDDGSTSTAIPIGFNGNFFGTSFNSVFVNNNGNVTLGRPLSTFTPFGLTGTVSQIIAPFFGDVDTRGAGSGLTTYGQATVSGRPSFIVNWIRVGYYGRNVDRLNSFQLVMTDRSDLGVGNFDIEFNYDQIQWETGDASGGVGGLGGEPARVGFSNGTTTPGTYFELAGSGVSGALLDSDSDSGLIHRSLNSTVPGRYLFRVRNGLIQFGNLLFSMGVSPNPAGVGTNLTYAIRVDNLTSNTFSSIEVLDPLPPELTYVSSTTSQGSSTLSSGVVRASLGNLPGNSFATVTIEAKADVVGEICNTAQLQATDGDSLYAEACVSVIPARTHGQCITRSSRYWFTHPHSDDADCATLLRAIEVNRGLLSLGFLTLPLDFRNGDDRIDEVDALIEALGLYWRSAKRTGENNGTQSLQLPGSALCRARKSLAVEIISAQANFIYLETYPTDCYYDNSGTLTNFPMDLLETAKDACSGSNVDDIRVYAALLRRFNSNGTTNNFYGSLKECDALSTATLRKVSRDPTSQLTCPGLNDRCETAEEILATSLPYSRTVNLERYDDDFAGLGCGAGGSDAVWMIRPPTAGVNRHFVVTATGSGFNPAVSVYTGGCDALIEIGCSSGAVNLRTPARVVFQADGTSTYYIVVEGATGVAGSVKLKVSSF